MKILIVRNFPSYMDVRRRTYNIQELGLAKSLVRMGNTCGVVFWTDRDEEQIDYVFEEDRHICIYYKKGISLFHNTVFPGMKKLADSYDIIQSGEYNQLETWLLAKQYPGKTVVYHGPYYSEHNQRYHAMCRVFDLFLLKTYLRNRTRFIVKSRLAMQFLLSKGILREDIKTLGVGMDMDALETCGEEIPEYIREAGRKGTAIRLLYIGHLDPGRNILFILETMKAILDMGQEAVLNLVGTGKPEYTKTCWSYAQREGLMPYIRYAERMEQKYLSGLYQASDFFLLPTRYDIFGMVLLEAMYYGLAVLTTHNGGSTMMIRDGENGFCLQLDAVIWARLIVRLHGDRARMEQIGRSAHRTVAEGYTWDVLAPRFLAQYRQVLDGGGAGPVSG